MAETPYLVDSNVLLRWVQPNHSDYPTIVSAIGVLLRQSAVLCYTSQNVAEFWNTCTRPVERNGYGLSPRDADRTARFFEEGFVCFRRAPQFMRSGAVFWYRMVFQACKSTTPVWSPQCTCMGSSTF